MIIMSKMKLSIVIDGDSVDELFAIGPNDLKNTFLPENGCPIEKVDVSDDIVLILIDSQWYMSNWDKQPTINDDCEIKTREGFFAEYESLIKNGTQMTQIYKIFADMCSLFLIIFNHKRSASSAFH